MSRDRRQLPDFWNDPRYASSRGTTFAETSGRWIVRASSDGFFGVRVGVQFRNGVGRTDRYATMLELNAMGFTIVDTDTRTAPAATADAQRPDAGPQEGPTEAQEKIRDERTAGDADASTGV
jgi:hypothetical protein